VARKRRRKRRRFKGVLLFILTPLVVWFLAFLIWFNWDAVLQFIGKDAAKNRAPSEAVRKAERSNEKILEEDRKRLDEILKKRQ
jgi:hypothetical protein